MYRLIAQEGRARRGEFETAHGLVQTPVFMNVGTAAAIKGALSAADLKTIGCQVELSNTYHLHLRPGDTLVKQMGGLHKFMTWDGPILTDSGGFQIFSLASLRKISEEGVRFNSHIDGRHIFMGPEESMRIQSNLGSDIAMAFDECIKIPSPKEYVKNYIINGKGEKTESILINALVSLIFKEVNVVLKFGISIIAISILCSLLKNLQDALSSNSISNIAFYACYLVLILILSKSFLVSISIAKDVIYGISDFMNVILPVLVSIIALSGGFTQAATLDPIILAGVLIIPKIYVAIIIPLILISFVLEFANNLSEEHKIDNLCKSIKQITLWIQGGVITIFIGILTIRGITSSTIDAVALKTTKFAVDNFIPIVGKAFSDAI